jgi:hypothetical protein
MSQSESDRRNVRTFTILGLMGLLALFIVTVVVVLIRSPFPADASGVVDRIRRRR